MGGFKRTVTITYGFVQALVDLSSSKAPDKDSDLIQLCTGGGTHAPGKPTWDPFCSACNSTVKRDTLVKGHEVAKDTYAVFTAEEIADLKSDDDQYKGKLALTAHDAVEVEGKTIPTGTTYYLVPNPKDQFFWLLKAMMDDAPDLAYMGRYTVTSRAATYRVRPYGDILVAEQMLDPEMLVQPPVVTPQPVPEQMLDMAREVNRKFVTPFDPANYANTYRQRLAEAVAAREAEPGAALPTGVPSTGGAADPMAAMMAQMAAMLGKDPAEATATPAPAKKAPAKRTKKAS